MPLYFALTLFTSATLLFLVQPMIAKMILPYLGGTPAVWNTCMVFFQAALLAGYAYAHYSVQLLGVRRQAILHMFLLLTPALFLPLALPNNWSPPGESNPIPAVLWVLTIAVGLPFFVISTSAPLLQKWFAETGHPSAKDPYFLYGASNLGSMLTLFAYPVLVEPNLRLDQQSRYWTYGYIALALLIAGCAAAVWRSPEIKTLPGTVTEKTPPPSWLLRLRWVALAFVPSSLMLGVTTHMTTDIAAIPLLWVMPLALYLLSFILVFSRWPGVLHNLMVLVLPVIVLLLIFLMLSGIRTPSIEYDLLLHLVSLFVVSLVCHGELARTRPSTEYLTGFYLLMSLGGVLGGLFNALVAPLIFTTIAEYPTALVLACLLLPSLEGEEGKKPNFILDIACLSMILLLSVALFAFRLYNSNRPIPYEDVSFFANARSVVLGLLVLAAMVYYVLRDRDQRVPRLFDLLIAGSVGVLTFVLIVCMSTGIRLDELTTRVNSVLGSISNLLGRNTPLAVDASRLRQILMFGLPPLLCYTMIVRPLRFGLAVGAVVFVSGACSGIASELLYRERSFFGVLSVKKDAGSDETGYHELIHGTTLHGMQSLTPEREMEPLTYYHRTGPIGKVFEAMAGEPKMKHVALVGLGTGTLTSYGQSGQTLTIYEIDPSVLHITRDLGYFTYLKNSKAKVDVVMGDARLRLKDAPDHEYGLIVLDAFSSDAIPVHLMTKEALQLYLQKLTKDGIIAFHVSNRYLKLEPIVANIAASMDQGLKVLNWYDNQEVDEQGNDLPGKSRSHWVLVARNDEAFGKLLKDARWEPLQADPAFPTWTDDFSNLYSVFDK